MVQSAGQQIERRLDLVAGGLPFQTPRPARDAGRVLFERRPQPRHRGLEQPAVLVEQHPMVQSAGQQIERRLDLVAGGLQFETPRQAGAAVALLAALHLDRYLLGPAFGATASIGLLAAILAFLGHGLPDSALSLPSARLR